MVDSKEKVGFFLLFLYFVIFPLGQFVRIELSNFTLQPVDFIAGLIGIWGTFTFKRELTSSRFFLIFSSFIAVAFYSLVLNGLSVNIAQFAVGASYAGRLVAYFLFFLTLTAIVRRNENYKEIFIKALLAIGLMTTVIGFLQYLLVPDTRGLSKFGWDPHFFRLIGSQLDPAFTGILIVLFVSLVLSRVWGREHKRKDWSFALLGIAAVAASYSRASYISLAVVLLAYYIVRRQIKILLLLLAFFGLVVYILPKPGGEGVRLERSSTISLRFENYLETIDIAKEKPLFGVGFNLIKYSKAEVSSSSHSKSGSDSSLLLVFATTGMAGFLIFLSAIHKIGKKGWNNRKTDVGLTLFCSAVALFVHSFFNNSLFYPWVIGWMAILLSVQED